VKPFLLSAALRATLAQRLVRKLCVKCAAPHTPSPRELAALGLATADPRTARFRRAVGCPACDGTGYCGRMGIFEIFSMNDEIRRLVHEHASAARLRSAARAAGMRTMREDGAQKAIAGLTTIEEVVSIAVGDAS
jgi:general secretion pathway protein E/type IV pilus assembly protein PilB